MLRLRIMLALCLCCLPVVVQAQTFNFPLPSLPMPGAAPAPSASAGPATPAASGSTTATTTPAPAAHAPVMFNNQVLFQVYAPTAGGAQDRADLASLRLSDALKALPRDAAVKPPRISVAATDTDTVLQLDGQSLLTVTDADAANYHEEPLQLADTWAGQIRAGFAQAVRERRPGYLRHAAIEAGIIVAGAVLLHLLLWFVAAKFSGAPGWPVQVLLWWIVVRWALYLFPLTRPFDSWLISGPARPVTILLDLGLVAAVLSRVWGSVLRRLFPPVPEHLTTEEWGRRSFLRRATLAAIARNTGVALIWFVAAVTGLGWAGVNLSALLTSAGLIGVGIGLATQDSMKDLVAGINILADDRFGVGDTIQVGEYEGRVEKLDLRITQIRDMSGRLITIPNRNIAQVANLTSRWAQVDLKMGVSYYDDLHRAMDLMTQTAQALKTEWSERISGDPEMLGVDSFNDNNITLRMLVRTVPGDQGAVARELRARIKRAFDDADIALLNTLHTEPAVSPQPAPPEKSEPAPPNETAVMRNGSGTAERPV